MTATMTRRRLIKLFGAGAGGALLSACQPKVVEVEKIVEVEKVVEQTVVVKEAVEVEKEVTRVVEQQAAAQPKDTPFDLIAWTGNEMAQPTEQQKPYVDLVTERFMDLQPNARLKFENHGWAEKLYQALGVALMGGVGPDTIVGESFIKPYIGMNALLPMDEYVTDMRDDFVPGLNSAAEMDGKLYGLSTRSNCFNLMANSDVLQKAGIDLDFWPADWTEWLETCQRITKAGDGDYYGMTVMAHGGGNYGAFMKWFVYMKQSNVEITKGEPPYPWFDNEEATKVYEFNRELHRYSPPGLAFNPSPAEMHAAVMTGLTAYHQVGAWQYGQAVNTGLKNPIIGPIPAPSDGRSVSVTVANLIWSVLTTSKHPDTAVQLILTMMEDDVQELVYPSQGHMPTRTSVCEKLKAKMEGSEQDRWALPFVNSFLNDDLFSVPQWASQPQLVWTTWNNMFRKSLSNEDPIWPMQQAAQKEVDDILAT